MLAFNGPLMRIFRKKRPGFRRLNRRLSRRMGAALGVAALLMQMLVILGQGIPVSGSISGPASERATAALGASTGSLFICKAYGSNTVDKQPGQPPSGRNDTCPICLSHNIGNNLILNASADTWHVIELSNLVVLAPRHLFIASGFGPKRPPAHAPPAFV